MSKSSKPFQLVSRYMPQGDQPQAIDKIVSSLQDGEAAITLLGVTGSGKTFTMANTITRLQRPTLILAPNKTLAAQLYGEMKGFFPHNAVEYFVSYYDYYQPEAYVPASDTYIEKDAAINSHIEQMRLSATKALFERRDTVIVASVSSIYGLGDPKSYLAMVMHLDKGDIVNHKKLLLRLAELQYQRNDITFQRGTYRVRGDVLDVFPADLEDKAVRIVLFDNEIEQLSYFDPLTGKVLQSLSRVTIYPKTHYVTPRHIIDNMIEKIKSELRLRLKDLKRLDKLVAAQRLEQRIKLDIEMLQELGYCSGIENYSRYLSQRKAGEPPPTFFDYLPEDALLIIDESHVTIPQLRAMYKGDRSRKLNLVDYGFRLPSALDNRPMMFEEFEQLAPQTIYVSATPAEYELTYSSTVVEQVIRPTGLIDPQIEVRSALTQVDDLLSELHQRIEKNQRILVTTLTKRMSEDLTDYLGEQDIKVRYLHSDIDTVERMEIIRDLRLGVFDVLVGINLLREGLDIPEVSLVAILDADKEGFLRSERALIQTIGRAARHIEGKVIFYAEKITRSMQGAIDETQRRRALQQAFNTQHNITPQGINKAVEDVLESNYQQISSPLVLQEPKTIAYEQKSLIELTTLIDTLEKRMFEHASNMEFEQAAELRDEIKHLQEYLLHL